MKFIKSIIHRIKCKHDGGWEVLFLDFDGTLHARCVKCGCKVKRGLK